MLKTKYIVIFFSSPPSFPTSPLFINMKERKKSETICKQCDKTFEKPLSEIKRNEELNRPNFCSRRCVGLNNVKNFGDKENYYPISKHSRNRIDEYTKFRYHYRNIKKRRKEISITLDDLKKQWEIQEGVCPFTGIKLILSSHSKVSKDPIYTASLDRIKSDKGYVKGNIRWVSRSINYMKNSMSEKETWKLCKIISENYKSITL